MSAASASAFPTQVFGSDEQALGKKFIDFVNASPSQFHAVASTAKELEAAGFVQVSERDADWKIKPGGKYYYTRNQSSIVAFAVGEQWKAGNGFTISAAHTDSPVLKLKPISKVTKNGYLEVGVEPYGGGLWYSWFDRDLSVAGRVIVSKGDGTFEARLVHIKRPILRVPSLAIHLNREVNTAGFKFNLQTQLLPVLATAVATQLGNKAAPLPTGTGPEPSPTQTMSDFHHPVLVQMVAAELGVRPEDVRDFELALCDTQPSAIGGAYNEFIFSRALDNLMMSFICTQALIASVAGDKALAQETQIRIVGLFDHEECGSASIMGAGSNNLYQLLNKLNADPATYDSAIARSYLVSADMAHALHPNWPEMHEENHRPAMQKGLVIKTNQNQRYATSGFSGFVMEELARRNGVPTQKFCVRNDVACGSTIGPILATSCGIRTVDVGVPQLSMHSIREQCGIYDVNLAHVLLTAFYRDFAALDKQIFVKGE